MTFTSFNFLIFFPILIVGYYLIPWKFRWALLLGASYFFYLNLKPVYTLLLAGVTISTYLFTRLIQHSQSESRRKLYMWSNILLILLPLFCFKYFGPINAEILGFMEARNLNWPLQQIELILPVGISFYTFMAIGYTVDVFNEEIEAEKHLGRVALFISFFPLILSGPIERAGNLFPQFNRDNKLDFSNVSAGLKLMLWGYFMKLVVADRLGLYVDAVFDNVAYHNGTSLLLASVLYPFQVYADLGGYSLIAIGTGRIMGITIVPNFRRPFFATSMSEFWRRWHMSLITWLTDYLYTPLSFMFRNLAIWGIVLSLLITFLASGIWHGAAQTFVIWGLLQGIFLSIEALTKRKRKVLRDKYQLGSKWWFIGPSILMTFLLFTFSEVFTLVPDSRDAIRIFAKYFSDPGIPYISKGSEMIYILAGVSLMMLKDFLEEYNKSSFLPFRSKIKFVRLSSYGLTIMLILIFGVLDGGQFIYFQF